MTSSKNSYPRKVCIKIKDLCKSYNGIKALDSLSLDICKGEIIGILGPNGAGKTTLVSILSAIIKPQSGSVIINSSGIEGSPVELKKMIGVVPQEISLYNDLTAEENISFFSRMYGLKGIEIEATALKLIKLAGLESRKKDRIKALSGGMKRRVNFACGLVNSPAILLLDEPTAGVDPQSREHIYSMIRELKEDGITTLLATHYITEAQTLSDRIAIIDKGKILMIHTAKEYMELFGGKLRLGHIDMEKIFLHVTGKELRD